MKVDRSRTIGVERPRRLASAAVAAQRTVDSVRDHAGSLLGLESALRKLRSHSPISHTTQGG